MSCHAIGPGKGEEGGLGFCTGILGHAHFWHTQPLCVLTSLYLDKYPPYTSHHHTSSLYTSQLHTPSHTIYLHITHHTPSLHTHAHTYAHAHAHTLTCTHTLPHCTHTCTHTHCSLDWTWKTFKKRRKMLVWEMVD